MVGCIHIHHLVEVSLMFILFRQALCTLIFEKGMSLLKSEHSCALVVHYKNLFTNSISVWSLFVHNAYSIEFAVAKYYLFNNIKYALCWTIEVVYHYSRELLLPCTFFLGAMIQWFTVKMAACIFLTDWNPEHICRMGTNTLSRFDCWIRVWEFRPSRWTLTPLRYASWGRIHLDGRNSQTLIQQSNLDKV